MRSHIDSKHLFEDNLAVRKRTGKVWQVIFLLATIIAIIALTLLMINIIDSIFGYAIIESKIDPATLAIDGVALEDQTEQQLIELLRSNLSSGAFEKLENEKSFDKRNKSEIYALVEERILQYDILDTWTLGDSLFNRTEIIDSYNAIREDHPLAQLKFVSWLTWDRIKRPQTSEH